MEKAIRSAIEGGWRGDQRAQFIVYNDVLEPDRRTQAQIGDHILLDPLFWQALGKSLGWRGNYDSYKRNRTTKILGEYKPIHQFHWHRFIDHLAEGKNVDDFFNKLLNP